ncbi:ead/Ea22-like family protein [Aneurinibacillus terranovensis]|uniref:ead/Ea22-like family protein n=1 Tax=Aneurinibacillus terranovensis TaxID=278991 RepID=UPI00138ABD9D|nr:ead/Ea22-like family protein [Aneurinibacillus terranovensis]
MTEQELKEIRDRLAAATPGPWRIPSKCDEYSYYLCDEEWDDFGHIIVDRNDAEFIAHAPEDIRRLLDEVERVRSALSDIVATSNDWEYWMRLKD